MVALTPQHRFFGIEEVPELQCRAMDQTFCLTTDTVSIRDLVRTAMRAFADRILVGEARGAEMLDILQVWRTGHEGGCATIHSGVTTPEAALERVEDMVSLANTAPMQRMIGKTIGLIVCVERDEHGRRTVCQVVSVHGYDRETQNYITRLEG
jgi:type IV secretion system protein VirB11